MLDSDRKLQLPSVQERLAQLKPSKELLDHYRLKIAHFDNEEERLNKRLDKLLEQINRQDDLQKFLTERENEVGQLQNAMSDIQLQLIREREHGRRLQAENSQLKIQELEDRGKIRLLLSLVNVSEDELACIAVDTDVKMIPLIKDQHNIKKGKRMSPEALVSQVASLQAQLEKQITATLQERDILSSELRVAHKEKDAQRARDAAQIQALTSRIHRMEVALYETTKQHVRVARQERSQEKAWLAEKDRLLQELEACRDALGLFVSPELELYRRDDVFEPIRPYMSSGSARSQNEKLKIEIGSATSRLETTQKELDRYKQRYKRTEEELKSVREQVTTQAKAFKERVSSLKSQLSMLKSRYEELDRRRKIEGQGYRTDVQLLRNKMKELEKLFYKVTSSNGLRSDAAEIEVLTMIKRNASNTKAIQDQLTDAKKSIYLLENDLKRL